jgi:hydroxypyruvate isomerase
LFLTGIPQAYQICRAVNSPSCKILDDLYHQQVTEGNRIPNIDRAWEEIAYFQVGDNPGHHFVIGARQKDHPLRHFNHLVAGNEQI